MPRRWDVGTYKRYYIDKGKGQVLARVPTYANAPAVAKGAADRVIKNSMTDFAIRQKAFKDNPNLPKPNIEAHLVALINQVRTVLQNHQNEAVILANQQAQIQAQVQAPAPARAPAPAQAHQQRRNEEGLLQPGHYGLAQGQRLDNGRGARRQGYGDDEGGYNPYRNAIVPNRAGDNYHHGVVVQHQGHMGGNRHGGEVGGFPGGREYYQPNMGLPGVGVGDQHGGVGQYYVDGVGIGYGRQPARAVPDRPFGNLGNPPPGVLPQQVLGALNDRQAFAGDLGNGPELIQRPGVRRAGVQQNGHFGAIVGIDRPRQGIAPFGHLQQHRDGRGTLIAPFPHLSALQIAYQSASNSPNITARHQVGDIEVTVKILR